MWMKKALAALFLAAVCLLSGGCGDSEDPDAVVYQVYYVSKSETKVEMHPHQMTSKDPESYMAELMVCLSVQPEKLEYKAPFAMGFQILDMKLEDEKLQIDVDAAYKELPVTTEVLVRAAVVRTLTQHR